MKKCPYCAESIQDEAIVCRYCGRDLPQAAGPPPESRPEKGSPSPGSARPSIQTAGLVRRLPRPISGVWYLLIGLMAMLAWGLGVLLISYFFYPSATYDYWKLVDTVVGIGTLLGLLLTWLLATRGRYGEYSISRMLIMLLWIFIPILNWAVVYYLGKGIYMTATKQTYFEFQLQRDA